MLETTKNFIRSLTDSLNDGTFVKLILSNYRGADEHLQKILVRLVGTKKGTRLFLLYRADTRDTAKNYDFEEGVQILSNALESDFRTAHLFTTVNDFQLEIGKKGKARLNIAKPTFLQAPSLKHDREKKAEVDRASFYLRALGITTDDGRIRDKQQDKWRQINRFVEIVSNLVENSPLKDKAELRIFDMGCGKGYLTFALYDHFKRQRGVDVRITGVDTKSEVIKLCSEIAAASAFDGLKFQTGTIGDTDISSADILIALHACNTATDDAIFKGITVGSELILVAPCCHQELRPQMTSPEMFRDVLKHGTMMERMAEMVTDGMRSMLLERSGYTTKLVDFVPTEHTPKNNLIIGTRSGRPAPPEPLDRELAELKSSFGITHQRLDTLLASAKAEAA